VDLYSGRHSRNMATAPRADGGLRADIGKRRSGARAIHTFVATTRRLLAKRLMGHRCSRASLTSQTRPAMLS
jgi:hypothetical protein